MELVKGSAVMKYLMELVLAAALVLPTGSVRSTLAPYDTESAPSFDLPLVTGEGPGDSGAIFSMRSYTFLVFWESGCPRCMEALAECESFHWEYSGVDVNVVGINTDESGILEISGLVESSAVTFTQLWDRGGSVAGRYGVPRSAFAVYLVDGGGRIIGRSLEPRGDVKALMESMLEGAPVPAETARAVSKAGAARPGEFTFRGSNRIRFLSIDAAGDSAEGPYGELVQPGNNILERFELEISRDLGKHLRFGGLLRISNEGREVLEAGPEYFGSEWGSAFAEMSAAGFMMRFGYYPISMTPLTLMRWDWEDNPRIGGDAGCGCGAEAGVLLVESLEDLGPELLFEGAVAGYGASGFETRIFYAIPRRAEIAAYSLEVFGAEAAWQRYESRTGSFWRAGLHLAGSWENRRSAQLFRQGIIRPDPWHTSSVLTVTWEVPVLRYAGIRGEWILQNRLDLHTFDEGSVEQGSRRDGGGGLAGVVLEVPERFGFRCDYIRLEKDYFAPFAALSYRPDMEGVRLSNRTYLPGGGAVLSLFYKRFRGIDPSYAGAEREEGSFFGASLDAELAGGIGCSLGWLDRGSWRAGEIEPFDMTRRALAVGVRYSYDRNSILQLSYERVERGESSPSGNLDSRSDIFSAYLRVLF